MPLPKLTKLELQIMEILWSKGPSSIREMQEAFPKRPSGAPRPAYTTIQTIVYRLEWKQGVRRASKVANAHVFEAAIARDAVQHRMIDDLLGYFGGRALPILAHLIDSGKLTPKEVREAQRALRDLVKKGNSE